MSDLLPEAVATATSETAPVAPTEATAQAPTEAENPGDQAETTETAATSTETTADSAAEGDTKKFKGGFQKRIDELTTEKKTLAREKFETELRAQQYQRELEQLRQQSKPDLNADPGAEPKIENFSTVEDFVKALREYGEKTGYQKSKQEAEKAAQEATQRKQIEEARAVQQAVQGREYLAQQKYGDYVQSVAPYSQAVLSNPTLTQFLIESEHAPDVFYALSKDPAQFAQIAKMTPIAAGRELLKLEAKLTAPPPPKPVTKAPDPIKPVGSSEKAPFSYETASMEEFAKRRAEEKRRKTKG